MSEGTAFYTSVESATHSPLAIALFEVDGVKAIFLGADFITITKQQDQQWDSLKPLLLNVIMEHYLAGKPVVLQAESLSDKKKAAPDVEEDSEIVKQIKELIETRVRPAVAMDGGDIIFHDFQNGVVTLELHGACSGCPSSTMTLKQGIENMLRHYVPEVESVEAVA